jgi:ligand-binding sensor domain-containing protein
MNNSDVQRGIVVYDKKNNIWYHIDSGVLAQGYQKVGEILIDDQGYKWMPIVSGEKGLFIFDDNGTISNPSDDRYRSRVPVEKNNDIKNAGALELWDENGEQLTEIIYCLAKDKNGYIWIGTDIGILVQYDPYNIFNIETPVFTRIKVPRNDGSGLADYLLENQEVTAIAVDNANRKYCGTGKSGIYLISEEGTKTVKHFTSANSPLPSDNIVSINIDENNGKVYIATDKGLISFQGDAVKGESTFSDVYVYPNPVRPGYEGNMTITGLIDQTNVKITDTAGNLVYETISLGGNALWNGKNLWGQKVKPGIYIVFLTSPNGSQSESTKIAIIR